MSCYRRLYVPGGTWFFTLRLADPGATLLVDHVQELRMVTALVRRRRPFEIDCAVVLPAELHMIWTLPPGDADFSTRWRLIKSGFSRLVEGPAGVRPSLARKGERGVWQRRFWEHLIPDEADLAAHRDFCLNAPVRAGLVRRAVDWPWSSVHRDLSEGRSPPPVAGYWPLRAAQ